MVDAAEEAETFQESGEVVLKGDGLKKPRVRLRLLVDLKEDVARRRVFFFFFVCLLLIITCFENQGITPFIQVTSDIIKMIARQLHNTSNFETVVFFLVLGFYLNSFLLVCT